MTSTNDDSSIPGLEKGVDRMIEDGSAVRGLSACGDDPLKADPLACAEEITGIDYKDEKAGESFNNPAMGLGFLLMHAQSKMKQQQAEKTDDTYYGISAEKYKRIVEEIGFVLVLDVLFVDKACSNVKGDEDSDEHFYIYWLEGLLLCWSTYNKRLNGSTVYLNMKGKSPDQSTHTLGAFSGGYHVIDESKPEVKFGEEGYWDNMVHVASFDGREFLRQQVKLLQDEVIILPRWAYRGFLWLVHYGEEHESRDSGEDIPYQEINEQRIALFPEEIRQAITP